MSYEEAVRAKHAFQNSLKEFFRYASAMTTEEVELAMGRIADRLSTANSEEARFHYQVKGTALKMYFDFRQAANKSHAMVLRLRLKSEMKEYFSELGAEEYVKQEKAHSKRYLAFKDAMADYWSKFEKWQEERKKHSLLKRMFNSRDLPEPPEAPDPVSENFPVLLSYYVEEWKQKANMGEFLIAKVTDFAVFSIDEASVDTGSQAYDITPEDVQLLAPN